MYKTLVPFHDTSCTIAFNAPFKTLPVVFPTKLKEKRYRADAHSYCTNLPYYKKTAD